MIIYPNKSFVTRKDRPNGNFADKEHVNKVLVIDDNSELGKQILLGFEFDVEMEDEKVVNVYIKDSDIEREILDKLIPSQDEIRKAETELLVIEMFEEVDLI